MSGRVRVVERICLLNSFTVNTSGFWLRVADNRYDAKEDYIIVIRWEMDENFEF